MLFHVAIVPDHEHDYVKGEEVYGILLAGKFFQTKAAAVKAAKQVGSTMAVQTIVTDEWTQFVAGPF